MSRANAAKDEFLAQFEAAAARAQTLTDLASEKAWPELRARTNLAAGHIAVARGDFASALSHFERAVEDFGSLELVLDVARARLAMKINGVGGNRHGTGIASGTPSTCLAVRLSNTWMAFSLISMFP